MNAPILLNGITLEELADALKPLLVQQSNVENDISNQDILTPEQVCSFLSLGKTTLNKHSNSGRFERLLLEGKVYYSKAQILQSLKTLKNS
jgi:hypothetical protein